MVGTQGHPRRSRGLACSRDRPQAIFDRLTAMVVHFKFSALLQGRPYEYVVRFALGGLATVVAGLVADGAGPEAGGLMLAFPAIFCASATLIEKHERERKQQKGLRGEQRGKGAAALDAAGAGWGSI